MGKRDYRHRESKKPRKDVSKLSVIPIIQPSSVVDVVQKKKKKREEEEEEEEEKG